MKKDTRENASFEELQRDAQRHWSQVGKIRDERWPVVRQMLQREWVCTICGTRHQSGGVCTKCREARIVEVE